MNRGNASYTGPGGESGANGQSGSLFSRVRGWQGSGFSTRPVTHWVLTTEPALEGLS